MNQQPSAQREPPAASPVGEVSGGVGEGIDQAAPALLSAPTQAELLAVAERVRGAFPLPVAEAELVLIDVDPHYLHAFWTVPFHEAERVLGRIAGGESAPMVLRICPVDSKGDALPDSFDIEVLGLQGTFYVDVWDTPRRYRATLGYRLADGTLVSLAASDAAELPPVGPSDDRTWREIAVPPPTTPPPISAKRPAVMPAPAGLARRGEPADPAEADAPPAAATPADALPSRIAALSARIGADAAAPQLAAAGGGAPLVDAGGPPAAAEATVGIAASPAPLPPSPGQPPPEPLAADEGRPQMPPPFAHPDHRPDIPAGGDRERPVWEMAAGAPGAIGSDLPFWELPALEATEAMGEESHPAPEAAAPTGDDQPAPGETPPLPAAADEGPPALPLPAENVLSLSSFLLGADPVELEVNAELHVFGRVKPGRRLQLFGREVRVRPDGTFSVHRPLGSGAAIMPVLLTEKDEAEAAEEGRETLPGDTE